MSRLGLLFNLTPTEEQYINMMLGKLESLGVTYPTLSNIEVTDTPKIIEALMSKIRFAFLSEFSVYAMHNDFDFEKAQALYPQRYIGGKECMCGILYRQAGNSIVVPVLQAIVRELKQYF